MENIVKNANSTEVSAVRISGYCAENSHYSQCACNNNGQIHFFELFNKPLTTATDYFRFKKVLQNIEFDLLIELTLKKFQCDYSMGWL